MTEKLPDATVLYEISIEFKRIVMQQTETERFREICAQYELIQTSKRAAEETAVEISKRADVQHVSVWILRREWIWGFKNGELFELSGRKTQ